MFKPYRRLRRLRRCKPLRDMVRETRLSRNDFIFPMFAIAGKNIKNPIASMPGHYQLSVDKLLIEAREVCRRGIPAVLLFGIPERKDATGSDATDDNGIIARSLRALKDEVPDLYLITDVCFCEYTDHGHCGPIKNGRVDNDSTLDLLGQQALVHAKNGADMVAPSGMMDGMVGAIRSALDEGGYDQTPIMSYAAKYASGFYGPFRDAAQSSPKFGDRNDYQMDPANAQEAMREVALDVEEGADIVMVKPAMPYLDILHRVKIEFEMPTAAYQVSGEFAMLKAAAERGWLDHDRVVIESLTAIKRAGADLIISYFALEIADKL